MNMRTVPIILASAALSACVTTVADLESKPPRATYYLERSPEGFVQCILETMGNLGSPNHYVRSDQTRVISYTVQDRVAVVYLVRAGQVDVHTLSSLISFRQGTEACLG